MANFTNSSKRHTAAPVADDVLSFERRGGDREACDGHAIATYRTPDGRSGITHLKLRDRSGTGLGVVTRTRLDEGTIVTICDGGHSLPWLHATAVRCAPTEKQYRVGLCLSRKAAA